MNLLFIYLFCNVYNSVSLFSDSIDTPGAMSRMQELVKASNIYISNKKQKNESPNHDLLAGVARYLTKMLKVRRMLRDVSDRNSTWHMQILFSLYTVLVKDSSRVWIYYNCWLKTTQMRGLGLRFGSFDSLVNTITMTELINEWNKTFQLT